MTRTTLNDESISNQNGMNSTSAGSKNVNIKFIKTVSVWSDSSSEGNDVWGEVFSEPIY